MMSLSMPGDWLSWSRVLLGLLPGLLLGQRLACRCHTAGNSMPTISFLSTSELAALI